MSRKYFNIIMLSGLAIMASSCNFAEKNLDPNHSKEAEPGHLLTYTQLNTSVDGNTKNMQIGTCMAMVQQTSSDMTTEFGIGDKYFMMGSAATTYFLDFYSSAIKNWRELEYLSDQNPEQKNMQGVVKIWGAYLFQRMTDLYGDVPYSEAGMGFRGRIFKPQYDSQKDIYLDMIKQVKEGIVLLAENDGSIKGDLFYGGNLDQWKKFANSLLLHMGMRIAKVEPELAEATVKEAISGGIMKSASDAARVQHDSSRDYNKNQVAFRFSKDNALAGDKVKISKTFVDYLKATNDPRLSIYCSVRLVVGKDAKGNPIYEWFNDPEKLKGLPNGYDKDHLKDIPGFTELTDYATFSPQYIIRNEAPTILMTASETLLLEAEAILDGWVDGDADAIYDSAIKVALDEITYFYGADIPKETADAFVAQKLFQNAEGDEAKKEVLGSQYWVATFMNGYESYANWRRTGYPKLTPVNYPGNMTNGTIPRRLLYATDEYSINADNLQKAIDRQGPDKVTTRIWWDVE